MRNKRLSTLVLLILFTLFITPSDAHAVVQSLNSQTGQNQTFANDSNVTISSSGNVHSLGWNGILPFSRGGTGASSFTSGSVLFSNGTNLVQDNTNLFWDDTNNRLGIGTSSPTTRLDVSGNTKITGNLDVTGTITGTISATNLVPYTGATGDVDLGSHNPSATSLTSTNDSTFNSLTVGRGGGNSAGSTAIGYQALRFATSISGDNTAIGYNAMVSGGHSTGSTAVGNYALAGNDTYDGNTAVGASAMKENGVGSFNVAVGSDALRLNDSGGFNAVLGHQALRNNISGYSNIAIGYQSALYQATGTTPLASADNSIYIGVQTRGFDDNDSNSIVIGNQAIGAGPGTTVIGNTGMGNVYFGSAAANANLRAKNTILGNSSTPGCLVMGDSDGVGVTYVTVNDGVISASTTNPGFCP